MLQSYIYGCFCSYLLKYRSDGAETCSTMLKAATKGFQLAGQYMHTHFELELERGPPSQVMLLCTHADWKIGPKMAPSSGLMMVA